MVESIMSGESGKISATLEAHSPSLYTALLQLKESATTMGTTSYPSEIVEEREFQNEELRRVKITKRY
eukprot:5377630-Amphidinium_carterae.1